MADFDWEEFLELAEEFVRRRGHAGAERSAISRAYYAVFHAASQSCARSGERLTFTGEDHTLVWEWFLRPGASQTSQGIGYAGYRLRQARRRADYDPTPWAGLSTDAPRFVKLARQVLSELGGLP